ncbi:ribonuclease J [Ponticoccus sp. SC2-23]|uniref:ribonuclease J n=1 Tax=Alexandriicola marinus TaxID=2081710 RepID=UPI000FD87438|nr:ribonuclease J [Alexandriicola marinus]MBM1219391.1 ribonuclease J [Ponticoccus sp. SC6-9]MBM1223537.1 ribonuclease J [Ponticoccus sp. SC6-15]MBM1229204.1 ribonuclease J [Ponticoccus sp. SC6-38]MBM1232503.1 ribonuclease J [Ponticoccus sp. SC6-45]MBM1237547.1 ribonuclease J [Ponticoccus sp. SC6-49]MBM1241514.1 ribonuclease J [Ponticoccus sp. SC2-64]MBM1246027.1 ribonuclease J [Ponticoccus sp. SC6-42]MBM1250505.1 ribonuclease J [Ponticoccus sp. SC6-33]MBM1255556.1 ribonuclease J [Ponticoc
MSNERLIYLPLGGAGEIGMNAYVYGYGAPGKERLIVVDLGVTFPDMDGTPGVDLILPDISWLKERREQIEAIFITHGHEDHIGAVGHYWDALRAPILARKFTGALARRKLDEHGAPDTALRIVEAWPETVTFGPFTVGFVPISHSIPESAGLVIDTPKGRVVHSGDFKIDETPIVGEPFDRALWAEIAKPGVRALICDSTNVFSPEPGRSEATLSDSIETFMQEATGMVVATTFASNVARLKTLATAAERAGRSVCLLGRAMRRMVEVGTETGLLDGFPSTISPEDVLDMPRQNVLLLVTGSQGERRAASAQLANGKYMGLTLTEGDTFLFSSKTIPGNERGVIRIMNQLSEMGVDIVDDDGGKYHVSGHANRPDLEEMHAIIRPAMMIPMHGEHRHLRKHARIAEEAGLPSIVAVNGMMIDLSGNRPSVAEYIETGRTYIDGTVQIGALDGIVRDRIKMALNGHMVVTLILDENDQPLGEPWVELAGLPETGISNAALVDVIEEDLGQFVNRADRKTLRSEEKLDHELRRIARNSAQSEIGKKPEVTVVVSRLS